jgi:uncharacterized protein
VISGFFYIFTKKRAEMDFIRASEYIIQRLRAELSPALYYHCVEHTIDVYEATLRLNESENIDAHSRKLIETAALFHDAGMVIQYSNHEARSVDLIRESLPGFGYTKTEIDEISRLIMVTRLPQRAITLHEQIICDADLDYLGRDDFFIHSFRLKLEWQVNRIKITTLREWLDIQIRFLTEHHYFTNSAILLRNEKKLRLLEELKQLVSHGATNQHNNPRTP